MKSGLALGFAPFGPWSSGCRLGMVADIGAKNPENNIFGNIGSVVRDALKIARHQ
jgi:hypothetical protein